MTELRPNITFIKVNVKGDEKNLFFFKFQIVFKKILETNTSRAQANFIHLFIRVYSCQNDGRITCL